MAIISTCNRFSWYFGRRSKVFKALRVFIFSFFALLCVMNALSQNVNERGVIHKNDSTVVSGNTYAIIIGISKYKSVTPLEYADRDAQAFENFLLSGAGGKIPAANIEAFLNDQATRTNVGDAISEIARKTRAGDRVYFFFAGHGDMEDLTQVENGLLLLYNSPNGNYFGMNDDVLEILELKRYLSPLSERGVEMIFIVDACHAGNLKGGIQGIEQTASALAASWGKEYKILSCQPNQLSLEGSEWGGGRGLFSFELEEGMEGLADMNNDGIVSMYELQSYIQSNVAKYSEGKQIPLITGDLSKPFIKVDPSVVVVLKKEKEREYPMLAEVNNKGNETAYVDSLDSSGRELYKSFTNNINNKKFILPKDTNALKDYRIFVTHYPDNPLSTGMRRNLAAGLNERFNKIVGPLLRGQISYSSRNECYFAAIELDSCISLLGPQHYMYPNLKARELFMKAMSHTWAINENEYNAGMRPVILKCIQLLEQSEELEPNAAYTLSALGILYWFVYDYEKADQVFQKYVNLRPNDFSAKYSLGVIFTRLKQYNKAGAQFEALLKDDPGNLNIKSQLLELYMNNNETLKEFDMIHQLMFSDSTKTMGYYSMGIHYSRKIKLDSAIYYYELTRKSYKGYCSFCDNNIGQIYFVTGHTDSARKYFQRILAHDSTYPFAHFNLGTIEQKEGKVSAAVSEFYSTALHSQASLEGFVTNLQLYFGKKYDTTDQRAYREFSKESFIFNMQYLSYLSMLYTFIRVPGYMDSTGRIDSLFSQLLNYKMQEDLTWFHYACYKALKNDTNGALESLEKALKLGFGNYFMLANDNDLTLIRNTKQYKALVDKYFSGNKMGE